MTDYTSGIAVTTSPYMAEIVGTYIEKEFFGHQQPDLQLYKDAKKYVLQPHFGNTVRFPIFRPFSRNTGTVSEGSNPAIDEMFIDSVEVTLSKKGKGARPTKEVRKTGIMAMAKQMGIALRVNANDMVTYNLQSILATRANRSRVDLNPAYQGGGTVDSSDATSIIDDALAALFPANDDMNGGMVGVVKGAGAGQFRVITDYAYSTGDMTVGTLDTTDVSSANYKYCLTDGIDSSMPITTEAIAYASTALLIYEGPKFGGGAQVHAMIDLQMANDLRLDNDFKASGIYRDLAKVNEGKLGLWMGVELGIESRGWTEAAGTCGTFSSGGAVHNAFFYGPECFGCVAIDDEGEGVANVEFYNIMTPDHTNWSLAYTTHGYDAYFAAGVPFGPFCHVLSCGSRFSGLGDVGAV